MNDRPTTAYPPSRGPLTSKQAESAGSSDNDSGYGSDNGYDSGSSYWHARVMARAMARAMAQSAARAATKTVLEDGRTDDWGTNKRRNEGAADEKKRSKGAGEGLLMRTTSMTSRSILVCSGQPREEYPPSAADACRWNQGPATPVLKCRAPMISHNKRPFDGTRERKKKVNAYESKGS